MRDCAAARRLPLRSGMSIKTCHTFAVHLISSGLQFLSVLVLIACGSVEPRESLADAGPRPLDADLPDSAVSDARETGCPDGWVDLDGDPGNGCEYECTPTAGVDRPDDDFTDSNCDGIDGDVSAAIFVAVSGADTNPGTRTAPKRSLQAAIDTAAMNGKDVYVAAGTYSSGTVVLANGVSIYAAYAPDTWARSANNVSTHSHNGTVVSGRIVGVSGSAISTETVVDRLEIRTPSTSGTGAHNYAMHCIACGGLRLRNSRLIAGNGGPGSHGNSPTGIGAAGGNGVNGGPGSCNLGVPAAGGAGGTSSCGMNGGAGGRGREGQDGVAGLDGAGETGKGGSAGLSKGCGNTTAGGDGGLGRGVPGFSGFDGANGPRGSGGSIMNNFWSTHAGMPGSDGAHGHGGGGGGGGGGEHGGWCNDGTGNGGGGGGGGGCRGPVGGGGGGGGGSFGLFLVNSTGIQLVGNEIQSGSGGRGGNGGAGNCGGKGGMGGPGATYGVSACPNEIGFGGRGGDGGNGGRGGHGGGGAGGPSYAVYRQGTTISTTGNVLTAGQGGQGGSAATRMCPTSSPSTGLAGSAGSSGMVN
jgi:hypothetical protein